MERVGRGDKAGLLHPLVGRALRIASALALVVQAASAREPLVLRVEASEGAEAAVSGAAPAEELLALEIARGTPHDAQAPGSFVVRVAGPRASLPTSLGLSSFGAAGAELDRLGPVPLGVVPCRAPAGSASVCAATAPLRLVGARVDREHPALAQVSLLAEVGGTVSLEAGGETAAFEVRGPRALGGEVHRLPVRVHVLPMTPAGDVALGGDAERGLELGVRALAEASAIWGQCGFVLEPLAASAAAPDASQQGLLEVGCRGGLPASGGELSVRTPVGAIRLRTRPGETAGSIAGRLADELGRQGLSVVVAENPRSEATAGPSFDLTVRWPALRSAGELSPLAAQSSDPTLAVCVGSLDLADGLAHFEDETARGGTLEERTLLRAVTDGDARTVDLAIVPYFGGRGRIGESFVGGGGVSLENLVIVDRAGVRATARSATLAHEIGHILLALPGHPDDFGRDDPTRLMDADASDATAFGPRRLELEDCERALRERGPASDLPLLQRVAPRAPARTEKKPSSSE